MTQGLTAVVAYGCGMPINFNSKLAAVKLFQNWDAFKAGHRYAVSRRSALYGFNDRSALPVGEGGGTSGMLTWRTRCCGASVNRYFSMARLSALRTERRLRLTGFLGLNGVQNSL